MIILLLFTCIEAYYLNPQYVGCWPRVTDQIYQNPLYSVLNPQLSYDFITNVARKNNVEQERAAFVKEHDSDSEEKQPTTKSPRSTKNVNDSNDHEDFVDALLDSMNDNLEDSFNENYYKKHMGIMDTEINATKNLDGITNTPLQAMGTMQKQAYTTSRFTFGDAREKNLFNTSFVSSPAEAKVKVAKAKVKKPHFSNPKTFQQSIFKRRFSDSINFFNNGKTGPKETTISKAVHTHFVYPKRRGEASVKSEKLIGPTIAIAKLPKITEKITYIKTQPDPTTTKPETTNKISTTTLPTPVQPLMQNPLLPYANKYFQQYRQGFYYPNIYNWYYANYLNYYMMTLHRYMHQQQQQQQ